MYHGCIKLGKRHYSTIENIEIKKFLSILYRTPGISIYKKGKKQKFNGHNKGLMAMRLVEEYTFALRLLYSLVLATGPGEPVCEKDKHDNTVHGADVVHV